MTSGTASLDRDVHRRPLAAAALRKSPTGIVGLDEVTGGGLPYGRSTLICGPAGCGKTLLALEFLVRGIRDFDEPGVFIAVEESVGELVQNVASMGFDLEQMQDDGKLVMEHINLDAGDVDDDMRNFVLTDQGITMTNVFRSSIDTV